MVKNTSTARLLPANGFMFDNLPRVAPDLKRRYTKGHMKSMVAIVDSGSTNTSISARAVMAMATQTSVKYSKEKVNLLGANGMTESTGSVVLTGVYCPTPDTVKPFSVMADINPHLPVDLLVGNDLSEVVGLGIRDSSGRQMESYPLSSGQRDPFTAFTVTSKPPVLVKKEKRRAIAQSSDQGNSNGQNFRFGQDIPFSRNREDSKACSPRRVPFDRCQQCSNADAHIYFQRTRIFNRRPNDLVVASMTANNRASTVHGPMSWTRPSSHFDSYNHVIDLSRH